MTTDGTVSLLVAMMMHAWRIDMTILSCPARLPHKGGGASMEQDFSLHPQGRVGMDLDFPALPYPTYVYKLFLM